jgi:hypothetical protein
MDLYTQLIYNVPHVIPVGYLIAIYFYITGLHMGFYTTSVVATLLERRSGNPLARSGPLVPWSF